MCKTNNHKTNFYLKLSAYVKNDNTAVSLMVKCTKAENIPS